ncbi:DNA damage checkpoint protein [Dunaliella salina]|uniref:DNA damage checkpoint protein n=1 Tax=Dunaliella salina TaxID=3046 RepID=A0ABQ7GB57_DUNSA|nr:DNA damage checkpoint protein [Dunaliella salina]|eukprot:KAF5831845.1 DNA damage checkpoint protein [Dunaliella salina]
MKFKATFTDKGLRVLEKAFLPTLEKCGKSCQMLLGVDEVNFIQTPVNTDGACVSARFYKDVLFHPETYSICSKHYNLIAFNVELGLLLRVLRAAGANQAELLEVKLTQKAAPAAAASTPVESRPYLTFTGRGPNVNLVQDLPISKPYVPREIDRLVQSKEVPTLCPYYVDMQPCTITLQAMVDKMKSISDTLVFATCKNGDVHINVAAVNMMLGLQAQSLNVFPQHVVPVLANDRSLPAEQQLQAAVEAGDATVVHVPLKHLARVLAVSALTGPSQILFGLGEEHSCVHIMFVFRDPTKDAAYDDSVALSFKLPLVEQ